MFPITDVVCILASLSIPVFSVVNPRARSLLDIDGVLQARLKDRIRRIMDAIKRVVPLLADTRHASLVSTARDILSLEDEDAENELADRNRAILGRMYDLDDYESSGEGLCALIRG